MPDTATIPNDALARAAAAAEAAYAARNPGSAAAYEAACRSLPGGNTRTVLHYAPFPLRIDSAAGAHLRDVDGHDYADFLGEYSAGLYGHSEPRILEAVRKAMDGGIVLGGPTRYEADLADVICARYPSCELVRFCNSGTEANLMALAAARAHTGRDKVLVFDGAYHGGVLYMAPYAERVTAPFDWIMGTYNDLGRTLDALKGHEHETAAILVEPMAGAGGAIPGDRDFLARLRAAADQHGIALIFDEVMTSRLGPAGLQGELGITPDLTSFGKYMGGGFSFGAFGGRRDILRRFDPREPDALPHAGTFNNNVASMAAGLVGLTEIFTEDVARSHLERGNAFRDELNRIINGRRLPAQVMGLGSILNVHFHAGPIRKPGDTDAARPEARTLFHLEMLNRGIYLARRGYMSLSLALTDDDYESYYKAFEEVLEDNTEALSS